MNHNFPVTTSLDQLRELLVLTHQPVATGTPEEWVAAEQRLGKPFPADYRLFVSEYGHCSIAGDLHILNPFTDGFWSEIEREREVRREFPTVSHPEDPLVSVPRPDGMIPWGSTGDGGLCFWVPDGDPDTWTVFEEWELSGGHFAGGMTDFLLASFRGEHAGVALGTPFPASFPAPVDPVGSIVGVHVTFSPTKTSYEEVAEALLRVVPNAVADGGNGLVTRPGGPRLSWWPHSFSMALSVDHLAEGKELAVEIASALDVGITSVSEPSWSDLVVRGE